MLVRVVERRVKVEQLVGDNPKAVQINFMAVHVVVDHLRAQVFDGAADSLPDDRGMHAAAEVRELDVVVVVKKDILQFYIPVHDIALPQVGHGLQDLRDYRCYFLG